MNVSMSNYKVFEYYLNQMYGGYKNVDDTYTVYVFTKKMELLEIITYNFNDLVTYSKYNNLLNFFIHKKYNPVPLYLSCYDNLYQDYAEHDKHSSVNFLAS